MDKETKPSPMNLEEFSEINIQRCDDPTAFNCGKQPMTYFSTALAEEVGEVAGIIKKLARGFNSREFFKLKEKIIASPQKYGFPNRVEAEALDVGSTDDVNKLRDIWADGMWGKLAEECADVFTYLDLICSRNDIDLMEAVRNKFNKVSKEMGIIDKYKI